MKQKQTIIETIYPLSPLQQGMFYHILNNPEQRMYFEHWQCTLSGQLDVDAYKRAWDMVIQRHGVLRTVFSWKSRKEPLQIVLKQVTPNWSEDDWSHLSLVEQQTRLDEYVQKDQEEGFALNKPLLRFKLVRLAEEKYRFIWSHHHILFDGWSLGIILTDVLSYYESLSQGHEPFVLPAPSFGNYIKWLQMQRQEETESFWREKLAGFTTPTHVLPQVASDGKRETQYNTTDQQVYQLSSSLTQKLETFSQKHRITINTVFKAAWAMLLARYNRTTDVVYGTVVSGRPPSLMNVEEMVGLFINSLPTRVWVDEEASLLSWLAQVQAQNMQNEQYAHASLPDIQNWSDISGQHHLFDSLVAFENFPLDEKLKEQRTENGIVATDIVASARVNYPFVIVIVPGNELSVLLGYDIAYIDHEQVKQVFGHLEATVTSMIEQPEQKVKDISILTQAEKQLLLDEWNQTEQPYPQQCVHRLFEVCVDKYPENHALKFKERLMSYRELNEKINQLAHYLVEKGVRAEVCVGVCLERSPEMIIAILAVLKAGGIYVPLDPAYPQDRFEFMLQDTKPVIIITQDDLLERLSAYPYELFSIDTQWPVIETYTKENLVCSSSLDMVNRAAYIMYTSGSTGRPKGVVVTHKNILSRFATGEDTLTVSPNKFMAHVSNTSFDASTLEIWGTLLNGGCVVILPTQVVLSPSLLEYGIQKNKINMMFLTTSLFHQMVANRPEVFKALDWCSFGGEAVATRWVREILTLYPHLKLLNGYGPTESTVFATTLPIYHVDETTDSIAIGKPVPNTKIYILDGYFRLVPTGVIGDLYIGGDGLARGYLNRPQLTAEKFIPNPFSSDPGGRLYSTGDVASYRADGNIEFHGRSDRQVKIRGFRIEPDEVEDAIANLPDVKDAVISVQLSPWNEKALVAYVIAHHEDLTADDVDAQLREKLPAYMVPATYVFLDSLPLNPNGKIDNDKLPAPTVWGGTALNKVAPPRTVAELQLFHIWREVLGLDAIGIQDDFFCIGGHSLLAVHLISRIREQFSKDIPLASLFESPTIEQLAVLISEEGGGVEKESSPLVTIQPAGSEPPLFFVSGAGGNVFYFHHLAMALGSHRPFVALQAKGVNGRSKPLTTIEEMATYYIDSLQAIQPTGPYYLGGHSFGSWVAFEMARQLSAKGEDIAVVIVLDTPSPSAHSLLSDIQFDDVERLVKITQIMKRWGDSPLHISQDDLQSLTPDERLIVIAQKIKDARIVPQETTLEQVIALIEVFKANDEALDKYHPGNTIIPCPILLFQASETNDEDVDMRTWELDSSYWGWDNYTTDAVTVHTVDGDHVTMLSESPAKKLATCLNTEIAKIDNSRKIIK